MSLNLDFYEPKEDPQSSINSQQKIHAINQQKAKPFADTLRDVHRVHQGPLLNDQFARQVTNAIQRCTKIPKKTPLLNQIHTRLPFRQKVRHDRISYPVRLPAIGRRVRYLS